MHKFTQVDNNTFVKTSRIISVSIGDEYVKIIAEPRDRYSRAESLTATGDYAKRIIEDLGHPFIDVSKGVVPKDLPSIMGDSLFPKHKDK